MFNWPKHRDTFIFKLIVLWDVVDWYQHLDEPNACIFHAEDDHNSFLQSDGTLLPNCIVLYDLNTYLPTYSMEQSPS
jgi:hypothetical protein